MLKTEGKISGVQVSISKKDKGIEVITKIPSKFFKNPSGTIEEDGFKINLKIRNSRSLPEKMVVNKQISKDNKVYILKPGYEVVIVLSDELISGEITDKLVDEHEFSWWHDDYGTVVLRYQKYRAKAFFKVIVPLAYIEDRVTIMEDNFSLDVTLSERPRGKSVDFSFYLPYTEEDKENYEKRLPKKVSIDYCGRSGYMILQPSMYMATDWANEIVDEHEDGFIPYSNYLYSPYKAFRGMRG